MVSDVFGDLKFVHVHYSGMALFLLLFGQKFVVYMCTDQQDIVYKIGLFWFLQGLGKKLKSKVRVEIK